MSMHPVERSFFRGGSMRRLSSRWIAVPAFVAALGTSAVSQAQNKPAGAATGWAATTTAQGNVEIKLDPKQVEAVGRISAYFNTLKQMRGVFVQTDPDKKRARGRFALQKPGKFRFDYAAPSRKIMASDGRLLRIKEPDQTNEDAVELDNTPFRMLLKANVDLMRDARILDVQESEDLIVLALQDRSPDAPGRVQLFFVKRPTLDLKEWVVRDPQGLETKVEVSDLNKTDEIDPKIFIWEGGSPFKQ
jgi:outer membrane lipoprotein-sorting protein